MRLKCASRGFFQFNKALGGGLECLFGFAEREAKVRASIGGIAVETRARDGGDADLGDQIFRERYIVGETEGGNIGHDVIRAARFEALETRAGENAKQPVAALRVLASQCRVILRRKLQRDSSSFLQRRRCSHRKK